MPPRPGAGPALARARATGRRLRPPGLGGRPRAWVCDRAECAGHSRRSRAIAPRRWAGGLLPRWGRGIPPRKARGFASFSRVLFVFTSCAFHVKHRAKGSLDRRPTAPGSATSMVLARGTLGMARRRCPSSASPSDTAAWPTCARALRRQPRPDTRSEHETRSLVGEVVIRSPSRPLRASRPAGHGCRCILRTLAASQDPGHHPQPGRHPTWAPPERGPELEPEPGLGALA